MNLPVIPPEKLIGRDEHGLIETGRIMRSGKIVDILNPKPEQFDLESITAGLAYQGRFTGQMKWYYSLAAHSVLVSHLVPPEYALEGLFHDAAEAVLNDISRPFKLILKEYKAHEDRVSRAIADRFGLLYPWPKEIKRADEVAVAIEQSYLLPDTPFWPHIFSPTQCELLLSECGHPLLDEMSPSPEHQASGFRGRYYDILGRTKYHVH